MSQQNLSARFLALKTPRSVARLLGMSYASLTYLIYSESSPRYTRFQIRKRRGGARDISSPTGALKSVQRNLSVVLQAVYSERLRANVHGFVPGRGIMSNAREHLGNEWVLNVDLEDFFGSINFGRVRGLFASWPFDLPLSVATVIAQICCNENKLPQGAPTSPVISNLICAKLDSKLARLAQTNRSVYTRYADDITISTSLKTFPRKLADIGESGETLLGSAIERIINDNGFRVNPKKVRLHSSEERLEVTGLIINECLNVPRGFVRQIRCMMHAWDKFGVDAAELTHLTSFRSFKHRDPHRPPPKFAEVVLGKIGFIGYVRGRDNQVYVRLVAKGRTFSDEFYRLPIPEDGVWVVYNSSSRNAATRYKQGTAFSLVGIPGVISCWHVLTNGYHIQRSDKRPGFFPLRLIRGDSNLDLAILRTDAPRGFEFPIGDDMSVRSGDKLKVIGFPNWTPGQTPHIQTVTVSGRTQRFGTSRIVVSESLVAGMSGGPALNANGEIVGVVLTGIHGSRGGRDVGNQIQPISALAGLTAKPESDLSWKYDSETTDAPRYVAEGS